MKKFHINDSKFLGQEQVLNELISLALQVARQQRGEDHLQEKGTIKIKLLQEYQEFEEARLSKSRLDLLSELADLTYYTIQDFALHEDERDLHAVQAHVCKMAGVSVEQAYQCALAKYRVRASAPNSKNFERENAAIAAALGEE